jgi:hypothetical protein
MISISNHNIQYSLIPYKDGREEVSNEAFREGQITA